MKNLKIFIPFLTLIMIFELLIYKFFKKKNSNISYNTMIKLFCITGGWSNDIINNFLKKKSKTNLDSNQVKLENYFESGFCKKNKFLDLKFLTTFKDDLKNIDGYWTGDNYKSSNKEKLDNNIKSTKYYYKDKDLIKLKSVQEIIQNENIINLARKCLNCEPILYNINCWYSFPNLKIDKTAAQMWHFDMDRPSWVKFFFYLSDCNKLEGPHCFIEKTQKNNGIPDEIRMMG